MQIPNLRPVFVREHSNKMYSATAYYLSGWLSSTLTLLFYPVICGSISFWFLDFYDSSWENFFRFIGSLMLLCVMGSTYGFMFGCLLDNEQQGINWLQYTDMVYLFGCGVFINLKTANWFIKFIGYISPFRYTAEIFLRIMLKDVTETFVIGETHYVFNIADEFCKTFDFTFEWKAYLIAAGFVVLYFITGWITLVIKSMR